jgi:hypothetical protein
MPTAFDVPIALRVDRSVVKKAMLAVQEDEMIQELLRARSDVRLQPMGYALVDGKLSPRYAPGIADWIAQIEALIKSRQESILKSFGLA